MSWAAAKAKSDEVRGYPSFSTRNNGFFSRSKRQLTASLPRFRGTSGSPEDYYEKKDAYYDRGRGFSSGAYWRSYGFGRTLLRRRRLRFLLALLLAAVGYLCFWTCM